MRLEGKLVSNQLWEGASRESDLRESEWGGSGERLRGKSEADLVARVCALIFAAFLMGGGAAWADDVEGDDSYTAPSETAEFDDAPPAEDEAREWGRSGPYFGLGGHYALQNFKGTQTVNTIAIPLAGMSDGNGLDARLGYRINRWASFEWFFGWSTSFGRRVAGTRTDLDTFFYGMSGKFYPIDWLVQPYLVAGFGGLTSSLGTQPGGSKVETGFLGRVGAGIDFYVTPNIVVEIEGTYLLSAGPTSDLPYAVLGGNLQYRF